MGIQLQTECANSHLTNEHFKSMQREVGCVRLFGFFKDALISLEDVNQEFMERTEQNLG